MVMKDFEPNLTLLLDAPLNVVKSRRKLNPDDRFESEKDEFFNRIRSGYLEMAKKYDKRIKVIDASRPIKEVQIDIIEQLNELIRL
jgi:dTMP kinase